VKRDDHILEEYDVLVTERHCETTDDAGKDIKEFSCTVEFMSFVD
jgi:hypothetical protein